VAIDGSIKVSVDWDGDRLTSVSTESQRGIDTQRLFAGKQASEVPELVAQLFSLCSRAQRAASELALQAASGAEESAELQLQRERLVRTEVIHEYLWRFEIDLPQLFGLPINTERFALWRKRIAQAAEQTHDKKAWSQFGVELGEYVAESLLGMRASSWMRLTPHECQKWISEEASPAAATLRVAGKVELAVNDVPVLPAARSKRVLARIVSEWAQSREFANNPHLSGTPVETGALARQIRHTVVREMHDNSRMASARLLARLFDLSEDIEAISTCCTAAKESFYACGAYRESPTQGVGWVETARGLLLHRVKLDGEAVVDYQVLAPTEWNFASDGALVNELTMAPARSEQGAILGVKLSCLSLDPCVAHDVVLNHA
jgi:Ni,Fe-hydrogenase III large subunit